MVDKVDKLFVEYEKTIKPEKKEPDDHALVDHEGGRGEPPKLPSPSSSYSSSSSSSPSHHSNMHHKNTPKKPFLKLDIKFDLPTYNGECNAYKLNNWIRQIKVYFRFQKIEEDKAKIQLASLRLSGTALVWWESKLQKVGKNWGNLLSSWSNFVFALKYRFYPLGY